MERNLRGFAAAGSLFLAMFTAEAACAQKQGGILKMYSPDSPASMSIHEEATVFAEGPMMGEFNNLVIYDQHSPQSLIRDPRQLNHQRRLRGHLPSEAATAGFLGIADFWVLAGLSLPRPA